MIDGWLGAMWAAFVAAMVAVFVVLGTGGRAPSGILVVALVIVPIVITLAHRLHRSLRRHPERWSQHPPALPVVRKPRAEKPAHPPAPLHPVDRVGELDAADWSAVASICAALDARHVDWLRTNDFTTPWLDGRARAVVELEQLVAEALERPHEWELRDALVALKQAIESFVSFYNDNTFPDPLLLGGEWRFFESDQAEIGAGGGAGGDRWAGKGAQLHDLAARVADAYASIVSLAA